MQLAARICVVVVALTVALYLRYAHYPIGLDLIGANGAWQDAPLSIAWIGFVLWLVAFATRHAIAGIAATFATGWALGIVALMWHGGTLTIPSHVTGAIAGVFAAAAAILAALGDDRPSSRLRASWPAGAALLAVVLFTSLSSSALPHSTLGFGIKWLALALPITAVFATMVVLAVPAVRRR